MSYPEAFWLNMDSPAEVVLGLAMRSDLDYRAYQQVQVGPYRVDFFIPFYDGGHTVPQETLAAMPGVVVEVDGFTFHSSEEQFEADRARDRDLTARRKTVIRFSAREVFADPLGCVAEVQAVLEKAAELTILELIGSPIVHGMISAAGHTPWIVAPAVQVIVDEIPRLNRIVTA